LHRRAAAQQLSLNKGENIQICLGSHQEGLYICITEPLNILGKKRHTGEIAVLPESVLETIFSVSIPALTSAEQLFLSNRQMPDDCLISYISLLFVLPS